jgi:hypothetical protein
VKGVVTIRIFSDSLPHLWARFTSLKARFKILVPIGKFEMDNFIPDQVIGQRVFFEWYNRWSHRDTGIEVDSINAALSFTIFHESMHFVIIPGSLTH